MSKQSANIFSLLEKRQINGKKENQTSYFNKAIKEHGMKYQCGIKGHTNSINMLTFSHSGDHFASVDQSGELFEWGVDSCLSNDQNQSKHLWKASFKNETLYVQYSNDDLYLLVTSGSKIFKIDRSQKKIVQKFNHHTQQVNQISTQIGNNHVFISASNDNSVQLIDERVKGACLVKKMSHSIHCNSVRFHPHIEPHFVVGDSGSSVFMFDFRFLPSSIRKENSLVNFKTETDLETHVFDLKFNQDGTILAGSVHRNPIHVWNINNPENPMYLLKDDLYKSSTLRKNICFGGPNYVISGGDYWLVHMWDITQKNNSSSGRIIAKSDFNLNAHNCNVSSCDYHPSLPLLLSAGVEKRIISWSIWNQEVPKQRPKYVEIESGSQRGGLTNTSRVLILTDESDGTTEESYFMYTYFDYLNTIKS